MRKLVIATLSAGALSTIAWAFPWDTDMVDATYLRAFAWEMATLPEGTISVNHARMPGTRYDANVNSLAIPDSVDVEDGSRMFDAYCTACHGVEGKGKAPVTDNSSGKRYPIPPPPLSGTANVTARRSDGYLFYTIRDGGAIMPGYAYAMQDHDVWDVVAYMRTLDSTTYSAPVEVAE
jgi:mono/diheme cytochrome c family protein